MNNEIQRFEFKGASLRALTDEAGDRTLAAARALVNETTLSPKEIVERSLRIAGEICVYTNTNITVLEPSA